MKKVIILFALVDISLFLQARQLEDSITLKVGDKAPSLQIIKWLKGRPLKSFQKDQLYIIEFTEVNCIPCRKSIPHLNELSNQYAGKATILSVFIWGSNQKNPADLSYIKKATYAVKSMASKIEFAMAVDVPQQATANSWMKSAGQSGVPIVFVVDKSGTIAWIGNPMDLDTSLINQVLVGKFDRAANAILQKLEQEQIKECIDRIFKQRNDDYKIALKSMDSLIKANPQMQNLYYTKFLVLVGIDDIKANAWMQWRLDSHLKNFDWYHCIYPIFRQKNPNYELAIGVANRAFREAEDKLLAAYALDAMAEAFYKLGKIQKAIEVEQKAVKYSRSIGMAQVSIYFESRLLFYKK